MAPLALAMAAAATLMAGCAVPPASKGDVAAPPSQDTRPAERAASPGEVSLAQGIKAYQAGQYAESESQLQLSLRQGLSIGPDRANAHKYLAFIYCTTKREALCNSAFKAARQADPAFALSKAEAGHPMWGPVYRKALPSR
ncbi:MAG: TssQ family T6SS-associated lipoprotein [Aquabacterium sp.]|jgi:Tfp pilus assembly protein PilF